jgi:phage major head subunit gpT-like protein
MTGVISTGNHPKALWPGMHAFFQASYNEHPEEYREIFSIEKSSKNYEEDTALSGFGLAPAKAEGAAISYDSESQKYTKRYTHVVYGLGYVVTEEELEDNQYEIVSRRRIKRLAYSMRQTKEIVSANVLNRATTAGYNGGDGVVLLSTAHPSSNGNWSNKLSTAADLSEAALEDIVIQIGQAVNDRGLNIALRPKKLIVPVNLMFEAKRILKSEQQSGNANNDINALKGMFDFTVNHYLTDTDAWFIKTDAPNGMTMFERRAMSFQQDNDFDTANAKAKATMRFSVGWSDPRSIYGSEGAA